MISSYLLLSSITQFILLTSQHPVYYSPLTKIYYRIQIIEQNEQQQNQYTQHNKICCTIFEERVLVLCPTSLYAIGAIEYFIQKGIQLYSTTALCILQYRKFHVLFSGLKIIHHVMNGELYKRKKYENNDIGMYSLVQWGL